MIRQVGTLLKLGNETRFIADVLFVLSVLNPVQFLTNIAFSLLTNQSGVRVTLKNECKSLFIIALSKFLNRMFAR